MIPLFTPVVNNGMQRKCLLCTKEGMPPCRSPADPCIAPIKQDPLPKQRTCDQSMLSMWAIRLISYSLSWLVSDSGSSNLFSLLLLNIE